MAQPFAVDAVADALREVPFGRHAQLRKRLRRMKQGLRRDDIVGVAMDQQYRRSRRDLVLVALDVLVALEHQVPE